MTFSRANPAGWALFELLTSTQMNALDQALPHALDGLNGGTYTPVGVLTVDGVNYTQTPVVIKNTPTGSSYALSLLAVNGSGHALYAAPSSSEADANLVVFDGVTMAHSVTNGATQLVVNGNSNTLGGGSAAIRGFGGGTAFATATAGRGVQGVGGDGSVANTRGGNGVDGIAGASIFTGVAGSKFGGYGLQGTGGNVVGADTLHRGGIGTRGIGGATTTTGVGGTGVYGSGAQGPTASDAGTDVGHGVVGKGFYGLLGVTNGLDPFTLPTEFHASSRAALAGFGKSYGRGLHVEFSGDTAENEFHRVAWVGSGSGVSSKSLLHVFANLASGTPAGAITGIRVDDDSAVAVPFLPIEAYGRGQPAIVMQSNTGSGVTNPPHMVLFSTGAPDATYVEDGALIYLSGGAVTGLTDDALFVGSNSSRAMYDRVVMSSDRAAAQAWCKVAISGVGGATLGSNYGVATSVLGTYLGSPALKINLDLVAGRASSSAMVPIAIISENAGSLLVTPMIEDDHTVWLYFTDLSGTIVNPTGYFFTVNFLLFGAPVYGTVADRPTYFRP